MNNEPTSRRSFIVDLLSSVAGLWATVSGIGLLVPRRASAGALGDCPEDEADPYDKKQRPKYGGRRPRKYGGRRPKPKYGGPSTRKYGGPTPPDDSDKPKKPKKPKKPGPRKYGGPPSDITVKYGGPGINKKR